MIDTESLRKDLINYFGTAVFSGMPMAVIDLSKAERASEDELIQLAYKNGFDPEDYTY
ncbi:MAG: hypothetical protein IJC41_01080 [Firmicutes bacterium]|nr:hypothetical protein [Bacillota bacterium]